MSTHGKKTEIIERLLENCERSTRIPLGFLEIDENVYDCPSNPEEVVNSLTKEFSVEELVACGMVVLNEGSSVSLASALIGGRPFIVLRDATTSEPYELLARDGCISPGTLPVFEILRDGRTQKCLEQGNGDLFVALDIENAVMLRACGLPATLAVGLGELPLEDVDQFCESFGITCLKSDRAVSREGTEADHENESERHPDDPFCRLAQAMINDGNPGDSEESTVAAVHPHNDPTAQIRTRVVFLGWTPLDLSNDVPCQLKELVGYLHQLSRYMGVDLYDLGLWEVDDETIERLRFIAERGSAVIFQEAFLDAADDIDVDIGDFGKEKPQVLGPPADYSTALVRLHEATSSDRTSQLPGPDQRKNAWSDVQTFLNQQVINPLRAVALATGDPLERTLLMSIAELSKVFHMQTVAIGEQLSRRISERGEEHMEQLPEDQFKHVMAMADRLINMTKATERCSHSRTTIIQSRPLDSPNYPRLPHSG